MKRDMRNKIIKYAIENNCSLVIKTVKNKTMSVKAIDMEKNYVKYVFLNNYSSNINDNISTIKFDNIADVNFVNTTEKENFNYYILNMLYKTKDMKQNISVLRSYYMDLIDVLMSKEEESSTGYINLKLKKSVYPEMFKYVIQEHDNLLLYYFSKMSIKDVENYGNIKSKLILLIEQANKSQKEAINNALSKRVSVIEGPPGTGKTTTILNILSNLIYQGKRVLVVSKNNSAIDNVVEELDKMSIPRAYIRMGSNKVMSEKLEPTIEKKLHELAEEITNNDDIQCSNVVQDLIEIVNQLNDKENKLDYLINKRNELQELKNHLRHLNKKSEAFNLKEYENKITKRYKKMTSERLRATIDYLAKTLIILDENDKLGVFDKIFSYFLLRMDEKTIKSDGTAIHLLLEKYYLTGLIKEIEQELIEENFDSLKQEIHDLYLKKYIPISRNLFNEKIKDLVKKELLEDCINKVLLEKDTVITESNRTPKVDACKKSLIEAFPIVLTTVDSVVSNYKSYFKEDGSKVDYIIIDESSQCDILSALPVLYLAKNLIVVGDEKQLSAITDIRRELLHTEVDNEYDYVSQNFLSSINKTITPVSKMLLEHYRCDYSIINYCNKFFYGNQLKIYNDSKEGAMSIIDCDKGKYVEIKGGYKNEREIKTINEYIDNDITDKFIITPYKQQAERLKLLYDKEKCGTIHTFQGKGEKQVYFSAVLNDTKDCIKHLKGEKNLFTRELINVAVSRAKEKFVLVIDREFFRKNDENMRNLIEYIEAYGDVIPDRTICIFDYLYRKIHAYQKVIPNIDNPYEEEAYRLIKRFVEKNGDRYKFAIKLPLAEFVSDGEFLEKNVELKRFVLSPSHIDFSIYSESINKPLLAIEVDGKTHEYEEQKIRDEKKDKILKHMKIPLLRVSSKSTWGEEEFEGNILNLLK